MTGQDLINWIKENKAENLEVIIEHRDSGGTYHTAERLIKPVFCTASNENFDVINNLDFQTKMPNSICL